MLGPAHARAAIEHRPSLNRLRDVMKVLRYTQHIISTDLQTERLSTALRLTTRYRKRAGVPFIIWAFDWIQPPPHGRRALGGGHSSVGPCGGGRAGAATAPTPPAGAGAAPSAAPRVGAEGAPRVAIIGGAAPRPSTSRLALGGGRCPCGDRWAGAAAAPSPPAGAGAEPSAAPRVGAGAGA